MATQDHEIVAWLGDGWTDEQVGRIADTYRALADLASDDEEREALLVAIAQHIDGTAHDPEQIAEADRVAHARAAEARDATRAAMRVAVHAGMSESEAARRFGVTRMTVRAWMGK